MGERPSGSERKLSERENHEVDIVALHKAYGFTPKDLREQGLLESAQLLGFLADDLFQRRLGPTIEKRADAFRKGMLFKETRQPKSKTPSEFKPRQMWLMQAHPGGYEGWTQDKTAGTIIKSLDPEEHINRVHKLMGKSRTSGQIPSLEADRWWREEKKRRGWTESNFKRWIEKSFIKAVDRLKELELWHLIEQPGGTTLEQRKLIQQVVNNSLPAHRVLETSDGLVFYPDEESWLRDQERR